MAPRRGRSPLRPGRPACPLPPCPRRWPGWSGYAARGLPAHPRALGEHPCFGYAYTANASWSFTHRSGEQASVTPSGPLRVNNGEAALPALLAGLGIAALPDFLVSDAVRTGRLVEVLPDWSLPPVPLSLVTPPTALRPVRVSVAMEFLYRLLSGTPWTATR